MMNVGLFFVPITARDTTGRAPRTDDRAARATGADDPSGHGRSSTGGGGKIYVRRADANSTRGGKPRANRQSLSHMAKTYLFCLKNRTFVSF